MDVNNQTGVTAEGGDAFAHTEPQTDTAPASSTDTKPTAETTQTSEDKPSESNVPWHKDPRWLDWQNKSKDYDNLKAQVDELLPLKDLASKFTGQDAAPKIPTWFSRLYGDDQAAWQEYDSWHKADRDALKAEAVKEYDAKQKKQSDLIASATKHFEDSIAELSAEGATVDSNKLLKFVQDNDLVDSQGRWNYKSGFKFMRDLEKAAHAAQQAPITDAKKEIGDKSISSTKERKAKNYETPETLRGKNWLSL